MLPYDAVIAFSNTGYFDQVTLGNNLADYEDANGVVVAYNFDWYGGTQSITGRWQTGGYSPYVNPGTTNFITGTLGTYTIGHPLMQGVTSLVSLYRETLTLAGGATQIALWNDGTSLMAFKARTVGVSAYVGDAPPGSWNGDFARVALNAANWLRGGPCAATPTATVTVPTSTRTNTPTNTPTNTVIPPTLTPTFTRTATPTATTPALLIGHVVWQGRPAQPNALQQVGITLTLKLGSNETNYPSQNTDASGFFTTLVTTRPNGVQNWRVKGTKWLANSGTVNLTGAPVTNVEMGTMRAGDANNDNLVNVQDFNILKNTLGKACGDVGYDDRADFTGDCLVNVQDFNQQKNNFGSSGAPPLLPGSVNEGPKDGSAVAPPDVSPPKR